VTAGFVLTGKIWEFTDRTDDVGGNTPTGTVVYENVEARLQNAPNSLLMNIQGYETSKFFSATITPRSGMNLVEKKHYFEPTSPPNYRYINKMFRIVSIQEPNFHPADPRRYLIVNLERVDPTHGNSYQ
jgi:hypothetical protein